MQNEPEQAIRGVLLASTCGHHHKKDCTSCASAQNCTNAEIRRLHAELRAFAEREARLVEALELVGKILPSAAGLDDAPDSKVIACYMNMGELRAIKSTLAALKDRTHD